MTSENKNRDAFDLESVLGEDNLLRLRRAYHGLEAHQLSPEHDAAKRKLRDYLSQQHCSKLPDEMEDGS